MTAKLIATQPNHRNPHVFPEEKKPKKYHNIPTWVDGIRFDSKKEARRYQELLMKQKAGLILDLKVKPTFKIVVFDQFLCNYTADFSYLDYGGLIVTSKQDGVLIVEDTKGKDPQRGWDTRTPVYNLKKRLMRIVFGIEVREV